MDKEKRYNLIMKNARKLKQEVGTVLSLKECKSIIEDSFNDLSWLWHCSTEKYFGL